MECTIDQLLTWYTGSPDWNEDWQTLNVAVCDGKHCQDDDEDGMSHLRFLYDHKDDVVEVESEDDGDNMFDLDFHLEGHDYSIQSLYPALSTEWTEEMGTDEEED